MSASVKGVAMYDVMLFTQQRFGADAWEALLASMSPKDRQALASILPVGWYDLALYARLLRQLVEAHGQGRPALLEECGRFGAEHDLTTIHRMFMRIASPGFILDQAMKLWRRFQDTGSWQVDRTELRTVGTLTGWGHVDELLCRELSGYIAGMISHGNGTDVQVTHPHCRARGAPACVFVGTWR